MGVVYLARHITMRREVALKVIRGFRSADGSAIHRFRTEAASASSLKHPHIVTVYEAGETEDGTPFIAMEWVNGVNLAELTRFQPVDVRYAAEWCRQVAEGIQHAHQRGIIHRDLKPGNVLIDEHSQAKVVDFGLARSLDVEDSLTASGHLLGTPGYMSPEQAGGGGIVGPSTDIHALGALLFHLVTARAPFAGATIPETLRQIAENEAPNPMVLNPDVNRDLSAIILRCLQKSPKNRYTSASGVADDLRRFLRSEPTDARPPGFVDRLMKWSRREPWIAGLTFGIATFLMLATVVSCRTARKMSRLHADEAIARHGAELSTYISEVRRASTLMDSGKWLEAAFALESGEPKPGRPDLRGVDWWLLKKQLRPARNVTLLDGIGPCLALDLDAETGRLAYGTSTCAAILDSSHSNLLAQWHLPEAKSHRTVIVNRDELWVGDLSGLRRFKIGSTHPELILTNPVDRLAMSPNRLHLAACVVPDGSDIPPQPLHFVDVLTFRSISTPGACGPALTWLDDDTLLAVEWKGRLVRHRPRAGSTEVLIDWKLVTFSAAFSRNARWVAHPSDPGEILVRSTTDGAVANTVHTEFPRRGHLSFDYEGQHLVVAGISHGIRLYPLTGTNHVGRPHHGHRDAVTSIISPAKDHILSASLDQTIRRWNLSDSRPSDPAPIPHNNSPLFDRVGCFSADGSQLALTTGSGRGNESFILMDLPLTQGHLPEPLQGKPSGKWPGFPLAFEGGTPNSIFLWNGSGLSSQWNPVTGGVSHRVTNSMAGVYAPQLTAANRWIFDSTRDRQLARIDFGNVANRTIFPGQADSWRASPDGEVVIVNQYKGTPGRVLSLWNPSTNRVRDLGEIPADAFAFTPDSRWFAVGGWDHVVRLYDCASIQMLGMFRGHQEGVAAVAFSPDRRTLMSGDQRGDLKFWRLPEGVELRSTSIGRPISAISVSPNARHLIITVTDGPHANSGHHLLFDL